MGLNLFANEQHWGRPFGANNLRSNDRGFTPTVTQMALLCSALMQPLLSFVALAWRLWAGSGASYFSPFL